MLIMPIGLSNGHIAVVLKSLRGASRHAIVHTAPFAALKLHFELLKSLFNLLPIRGLVLKAQLPQYIVEKHAGFGVCTKQARQVLQGIARVALKFCIR